MSLTERTTRAWCRCATEQMDEPCLDPSGHHPSVDSRRDCAVSAGTSSRCNVNAGSKRGSPESRVSAFGSCVCAKVEAIDLQDLLPRQGGSSREAVSQAASLPLSTRSVSRALSTLCARSHDPIDPAHDAKRMGSGSPTGQADRVGPPTPRWLVRAVFAVSFRLYFFELLERRLPLVGRVHLRRT